jgi:predicted transcriptional regulator
MVHVENAGGFLYNKAQLKELAMTSASTASEMESRLSALEEDVALLKKELMRSQIQAAIRRGREEAAQGRVIEATKLVSELRAKHNLRAP